MPDDRDVFAALTALVLENRASAEEMTRFRELLRAHPEFIAVYRRQVRMATLLPALSLWQREEAHDKGIPSTGRPRRAVAAFAAAVAAGIAAALASGIWLATRPSEQPAVDTPTSTVQVVSQRDAAALVVPDTLPARISLEAGEVTVRLGSGVELTLLGPSELRAYDAMRVRLLSGRLLADVPPEAVGFMVATDELEMWDLGTVFGVAATCGMSDVFVFQGRVQVNEAAGGTVDVCKTGEGVRAMGRTFTKVTTAWPEERRLFASLQGRAALAMPETAFGMMAAVADVAVLRRERESAPDAAPDPDTEPSRFNDVENRGNGSSYQEETEMKYLSQTIAALTVSAATAMVMESAQAAIDDPVAYWSFDDAGSVLSNRVVSGAHHDAIVLKGTPTAGLLAGAPSIVGNAMVLDGTSAIRLPYHQDNLGKSFSISLWYWQQTNDTRQCVLQSRGNYVVAYEPSTSNSIFISYVGQEQVGNTQSALREWVHLTHTFSTVDGVTAFACYTNGVLANTRSTGADNMFVINQFRGLHVGACRDLSFDSGRCFKGMIDELALWDRALTADEALAVYQRGWNGQKLTVTPQSPTVAAVAPGTLAFAMQAAAGIPDGAYEDGWLLNNGADSVTGHAIDTAGALNDANGHLPDTAGHTNGPFNAVAGNPAWLIPLAPDMEAFPLNAFSLEVWFRTTIEDNLMVFMGNFAPSLPGGVVNFQLDNGKPYFYLKNLAGNTDILNPNFPVGFSYRNNAWNHLVATRSGATMTLYLNGKELAHKTTDLPAFPLGGDYYRIGSDTRTDSEFQGEIGDARIWTRALSSNEVVNLAAFARPGGAVTRDGLLAEYALYAPYAANSSASGRQIEMTPQLRQIPQTNFTYEVKFRATGNERGILIGNYSGTPRSVISLELFEGNELRFHQWNAGGTQSSLYVSVSGSNIRDGAWHRVAAVRRDGRAFIYLDGAQVGGTQTETFGPYTLSGSHLGIGRDFRSPVLKWGGAISEARIWTRALTTNEIVGITQDTVPQDGLIVEYADIPTNTLRTAGFPSDSFFRTCNAGTNTFTLRFGNLPNHTHIGIGMLLAQLDSLDPLMENDRFEIWADGVEILSVGLGPNQGNEPQVAFFRLFGETQAPQAFASAMTFGGVDLFATASQPASFRDHVYNLSLLDALQRIPHRGSTLQLEFRGIHNMDGGNESFGFDGFLLAVYPPKGSLILLK